MAAPVINPQSSAPVCRVGTPYQFNLALMSTSAAATGWAVVDALPDGLTINATTGKISGTPTAAGVREVRITASNADGTSTPVTVAFGILPVPYAATGTMEINMDLDNLVVWNPHITNGGAPLFAKYRDKKTISLGMFKSGILQDKNVAEINVWLKEDDEAKAFNLCTGQFAKVGAGDNTRHSVLLNFDKAEIKSMMSNWDRAYSSGGFIWAEIEIKFLEAPPGTGNATLLPLTSRTFVCELQRDLSI
ncbi:MAG: Ig domain-containing protein [Verrucomicrobiaceae bacterium]|nr:Ig domain-containing protein [Verrucomicrobiaceae bacterium]